MVNRAIVSPESLRSTEQEKAEWVHIRVPRSVAKSIARQIPAFFPDAGKAQSFIEEMEAYIKTLLLRLDINAVRHKTFGTEKTEEAMERTINAIRVSALKKDTVAKALRYHLRQRGLAIKQSGAFDPAELIMRYTNLKEKVGVERFKIKELDKQVKALRFDLVTSNTKNKKFRNETEKKLKNTRNFLARLASLVSPGLVPWVAGRIEKDPDFGKDL